MLTRQMCVCMGGGVGDDGIDAVANIAAAQQHLLFSDETIAVVVVVVVDILLLQVMMTGPLLPLHILCILLPVSCTVLS